MTEIANARPELTEYHKSFIRGLNTGKAKNICVFKKKNREITGSPILVLFGNELILSYSSSSQHLHVVSCSVLVANL